MEGIYRLYSLRFTADGQQTKRMVGRFLVHNGNLRFLEDHSGYLHRMFTPGEVTPQTIDRLHSIKQNGYWDLIHEDALHAGEHPEHVPDLDTGDQTATPEATFTVSGKDLPAPQHLEVWSGCCVLDGKKLSDSEVEILMSRVELGKLTLTPHQ